MARKLIVEIVGDSRSLERSFARSSRAARGFDRDMSRFARGTLVGTGALGGLGRAASFASSAFIGGAGLTYALTSTVKAAIESQKVLAETRNAVRRSGNDWREYSKQINDTITAQSNLAAFDDEELSATFSNLVRSTGDVNEALRLNALSADVARGRNIDLQSAQQLVLKASIGQIGALRRLGINIDKNASSFEALNVLQQKYAGAAEAYGRTAAGSIDRFRVALENAQEEIGTALLPTITKVANATADWLSKPQNVDRLQNDAESLARAFGSVAGAVEKTGYYLDVLTGKKMPASLERFLDRWDAFRFDATFGLFGKQSPLPGVQTLPGLRKAPAGAFNVGIDPLAGLGDFVVGPNGTLVRRGAGSSRRGASSNLTRTPFLANLLAQAEGTSGRRDNENVLRRIIGALRGRLGGTSNLAARTDLLNSINQYRDQLAGLLADDAQAVKDAADRVKQRRQNARQSAADALQRLHDALQKQEDAQKASAQALIDQAGRFKSAILERLQQNRTAVLNRRALVDAQEQLRLARELGGVSGIRAAQRGLEDVRFDMLRARLDRAPATLSRAGQLSLGNVVTINVHGVTNPDVVATKVMEAIKRKGRHTTAQTRGPAAGLPHGV